MARLSLHISRLTGPQLISLVDGHWRWQYNAKRIFLIPVFCQATNTSNSDRSKYPTSYFLTVFLFFSFPERDLLIVFILAKLFKSPEQYLLIKFPV